MGRSFESLLRASGRALSVANAARLRFENMVWGSFLKRPTCASHAEHDPDCEACWRATLGPDGD